MARTIFTINNSKRYDEKKIFIQNKDFEIQKKLTDYKKFAIDTLNKKTMDDYITIIDKGTDICILMLELIIVAMTEFDVKEGYVSAHSSERGIGTHVLQFCTESHKHLLPPEAIGFLDLIKEYKNKSLILPIINFDTAKNFTTAFDYFTIWFYSYIMDNGIFKLNDRWETLKDFLIDENLEENAISEKFEEAIEIASNSFKSLENKINDVDERTKGMEDTLKNIEKQLKDLSDQIALYQNFVTNQLDKADSDDEIDSIMKERIIQSFVDECANRIINNIHSKNESKKFSIEKRKLLNSMGESAWNKLAPRSQTFLITSKLMYNDLLEIGSLTDYSGICILVTKALEVEMNRRFYQAFLRFLNEKYGDDYAKYHTALLFRSKNGLIPLKSEKFTMGSIAFAMGYKENWNDSDDEKKNNHKCLMEYVKSELMPGKTDSEITTALNKYGKDIEEIREKYRNPSAHINALNQVDALKCFNFVLDVEKILKEILDSFKW